MCSLREMFSVILACWTVFIKPTSLKDSGASTRQASIWIFTARCYAYHLFLAGAVCQWLILHKWMNTQSAVMRQYVVCLSVCVAARTWPKYALFVPCKLIRWHFNHNTAVHSIIFQVANLHHFPWYTVEWHHSNFVTINHRFVFDIFSVKNVASWRHQYRILQHSAKTQKFRGNGQIPRLGWKFRVLLKTVARTDRV